MLLQPAHCERSREELTMRNKHPRFLYGFDRKLRFSAKRYVVAFGGRSDGHQLTFAQYMYENRHGLGSNMMSIVSLGLPAAHVGVRMFISARISEEGAQ